MDSEKRVLYYVRDTIKMYFFNNFENTFVYILQLLDNSAVWTLIMNLFIFIT